MEPKSYQKFFLFSLNFLSYNRIRRNPAKSGNIYCRIQPESKTLKFKSDLSSSLPILKTIVAFANTTGGIIVIGCSPLGGITGIKL
jgi:hypothetical protein